MKKKRLLMYIAFFILVGIILSLTIIKKSDVIKVKVYSVRKGNIARYINTTGIVQSKSKQEYYAGQFKIVSLDVNVGDKVEKGQQLAKLEVGNIISDNTGTVTEINASEGGYTNPSYPLIVVQDINNLKLRILLNQYDSKYVNLNQLAIVKSNNENIEGKVSFISPVAKNISGSIDGEPYLDADIEGLNSVNNLKIGFKNEVDILVGEKNDVVVVPTESIKIEKGNKNYVFVCTNNVIEKREVKVGLEGEMDMEILEGIEVGEEVVLNPSGELNNGDRVKRGK
ncbi:efflux RND transporter periplasmic adaptor subunit [Clostridium septicum]|uniref:Efflux RND transporter periplasmic adaptor subunit n=1 Tax=Clostridium septicum TaxID=1504 RepID=A0A9N7PI88_CLOSE|nr:HlyD family efflux transporter periplasmic adaptor subunit [Clostridium septicum]AYE33491.1 hypothetical protein CP523_02930 [Clostridium septicum]MDU1315325.1 efflux RND transporter periplasmic adaptor subunit [Clostridium septicum]QAS61662.1 HlyD family efflux transporter periplasmic adaptor subunit [Clostridium septicum]UEC21899.1 efflux RND transporter periplasmic adaptor subunit [Clostridium septicum]USS00070.1 efflux RND transporter periplasmic adaptor subunit [Clostridium septicum]